MSKQYDVDAMNRMIDARLEEMLVGRGKLYESTLRAATVHAKSDLAHFTRELAFLRVEKEKLDKIEVILMTPALVKDPASQPIPDWIAEMLREIAAVLDGSDES